jgi:hypothetical protein
MSKIPEGAGRVERLVIMARRLSTGKNAAGETVCCLPKLLDPPKSPKAVRLLEDFVRERLIEREEEFRGQRLRGKNKNPKDDPVNNRTNRNTRNYRDRKRRTIVSPFDDEKIELESGVRLEPPWKRR